MLYAELQGEGVWVRGTASGGQGGTTSLDPPFWVTGIDIVFYKKQRFGVSRTTLLIAQIRNIR